uniref:Uncharacterized protein n=1 Tax=Zea mays TaxID=4577 RepID=A0A804PF19_MAIZE
MMLGLRKKNSKHSMSVDGVLFTAQKQQTPDEHPDVLFAAQHPTWTVCRARGTRAALAARKQGEVLGLQEQRRFTVEELCSAGEKEKLAARGCSAMGK